MKVYYGFSKLTPKVMRKPELAIYFENSSHNPSKNEEWIRKHMNLVFTREQTSDEKLDAQNSNRMFTKYSYFINEKPFYGDIEAVLQENFKADENNVSTETRTLIMEKLRKEYNRLKLCKEI